VVYARDSFRTEPTAIEEGATVRERQLIFRIHDIDEPMQVLVRVPEPMIDQIGRGLKAQVKVDAFPDEMLAGVVGDVAPLPNPTNFFDRGKVYSTRVKIDKGPAGLRPGMTAQVEIVVAERDNVLRVPAEAVLRYDDKDHLAVKKPDGTFERREVVLGISNGKL